MNEENKIKLIIVVEFIIRMHNKFLPKHLEKEFGRFFEISFTNKSFDKIKNESDIKISLFDLVEKIKNKYEKIIQLSTQIDIYKKIIDEINSVLPVFPFDWEEYQFKKLMEKTFCEEDDELKNNYNKINNIINKLKFTIKNNKYNNKY